jgi:hypothetical protein
MVSSPARSTDGRRMRTALLVICVLAISCASLGQGKKASWENLSNLRAGDKIQVRALHAQKLKGTFLNVSDTGISLQTNGTEQTVPKQEVQLVQRMRNRHRLRNALIFGGVGAGIGAGIGAASHRSCASTETFCFDIGGRSFPAAIGGVIGLLGGATAGAFVPDHETIYSTDSH